MHGETVKFTIFCIYCTPEYGNKNRDPPQNETVFELSALVFHLHLSGPKAISCNPLTSV